MTDIILIGCNGKMGNVITNIVSGRDDCRIVAGIDSKKIIRVFVYNDVIIEIFRRTDAICTIQIKKRKKCRKQRKQSYRREI